MKEGTQQKGAQNGEDRKVERGEGKLEKSV